MEEKWIRVRVQTKDGGHYANTDALYDLNNNCLDRHYGNVVEIWEDSFFGRKLMVPQPDKLPDGLKQGA